MRLLYSLIYLIVQVFLFPFEYYKRPKDIRKRWLREKLGAVPDVSVIREGGSVTLEKGSVTLEDGSVTLWVHAVSVGEAIAASSFIKALKERHPSLKIIVSTVTDTGQKVARERLSGLADVIYVPFDMGFIIKRAINRLKPSLFVTVETEMWPNTFRTLKANGIPVVVLNGRISDNSFEGYKKIKFFMKKVIQDVDMFCMQDDIYARRIIELGAKEENVIITGSFKFDIKLSLEKPAWAENLTPPVIVAGSTHKGEEELMVSVFVKLREDFKDLNLIIAPRHPERFDEVESLLKARGVLYVRRSRISGSVSGMVVLLDTIGELSSVYGISDVAVVGGSFIEHGGHNPLEPAYWGKPVVCGPHMENFPFVEEFYSAGAALRADNSNLYDVLKELLSSPEKRQSIGKRAEELLKKNSGAVDRAVRVVEKYLGAV